MRIDVCNICRIQKAANIQVLRAIAYLFFSVGCPACLGQSNCPAYSSIQILPSSVTGPFVSVADQGISRDTGAKVSVQLISTTSIPFDAADINAATSAVTAVSQLQNTNISLSGVEILPSTAAATSGTINQPVITVLAVDDDTFQSACNTQLSVNTAAIACVKPQGATTGTNAGISTGAIVYILEDPNYIAANFPEIAKHEILGHAVLGLADCSGNNCNAASSLMYNQGDSSGNNPSSASLTSCDMNFVNGTVPCTPDTGCGGGLECSAGICRCSNSCDDSNLCTGYSCDACGTNCDGTCSSDADCPGGKVCMGGTCGCSDACDDSSLCDGYNYCDCNDDPCYCDGECDECTDGNCDTKADED